MVHLRASELAALSEVVRADGDPLAFAGLGADMPSMKQFEKACGIPLHDAAAPQAQPSVPAVQFAGVSMQMPPLQVRPAAQVLPAPQAQPSVVAGQAIAQSAGHEETVSRLLQ